jgi:hypothetical protein
MLIKALDNGAQQPLQLVGAAAKGADHKDALRRLAHASRHRPRGDDSV